jgi:hypothetical protein
MQPDKSIPQDLLAKTQCVVTILGLKPRRLLWARNLAADGRSDGDVH